jgi:hypothetical protein
VVLLQLLVGDRLMMPVPVGEGLKLLTVVLVQLVLHLLVLVGKG